jgi:hypothetical protein
MCDKLRSQWEHVENLKNVLGTHWEFDENTIKTTKVQHPPCSPNRKET